MARPFDTPGAVNSRKRGWLMVTAARPSNRSRASGASSLGSGLAGGEDLGDRVADRVDEVAGRARFR
jgi:hypothetical protein